MTSLRTAVLVMLFVSCACAPKALKENKPSAAENVSWVMPSGRSWILRTLSTGICPNAVVDGKEVSLTQRTSTSDQFPIQICEISFPRSSKFQSVLRPGTLNPDPKRIVVIGDTGCKVKVSAKKVEIQACNDGAAWPFARVAKSAAEWHPDLVIHVGDYHYRESECPMGHPECLGSQAGDNWASWTQDFFDPARPLLETAPWIFVRGNHELCNRGGQGWFRLLDSRPYSSVCEDLTPSFLLSMKGKDFLIVDSAEDKNIQRSLEANFSIPKNTWLISHRPILTPNADDESALKIKVPKKLNELLSLFLVGHVHTVSINAFGKKSPPEFILGIGGSKLDEVKKPEKFQVQTFHDFGFTTLENKSGNLWDIVIHDRNGKDVVRCKWTEGNRGDSAFACEP